KWLPAVRAAVSPDGRRYAYSVIAGNAYQNTRSQLHVVDVATAADRVIYNGKAALNVVDFEAEGVFVTAAVPEGRARGLWLQDLTGSPLRLISSTIVAPAVGGGSAWGVDFNPADPSPGPGGLEGPMNRILRYDLSGASTPWFYRPGANIYLMGFDANGHPFVSAGFESNGQATQEVWLIASSGNATKISAGTYLGSPSTLEAVDGYGVWFDAPYASSAASTVWLYKAGAMQVAATLNASGVVVAGGCIPQG